MDPWEPLAAASDRPAGEQAERQRHQPDRRRPGPTTKPARTATWRHAGSEAASSQATQTRDRNESPGGDVLVDGQITARAVVVDARSGHEDRRRALRGGDRRRQRLRRLDPAPEDRCLTRSRPARPADRDPREVHDRARPVDLGRRVFPGARRGPGSAGRRGHDDVVAVGEKRGGERLADVSAPAADHDLHEGLSPCTPTSRASSGGP